MSQIYRQVQIEIVRIKGLITRLNSELSALEQTERLLRPHYKTDGSPINGEMITSIPFIETDENDENELDRRSNFGFPHLISENVESDELAGKKIKECAIIILGEFKGKWIDFRKVAGWAIARGYRSFNSENDPEKVSNSFRAIMKRNPLAVTDFGGCGILLT